MVCRVNQSRICEVILQNIIQNILDAIKLNEILVRIIDLEMHPIMMLNSFLNVFLLFTSQIARFVLIIIIKKSPILMGHSFSKLLLYVVPLLHTHKINYFEEAYSLRNNMWLDCITYHSISSNICRYCRC